MTAQARKVLEEALRLPAEARAALAGQLIESLDEQIDEGAEEAWSLEIARRVRQLARGTTSAVPWTEARRLILGDSGGTAKR